MFLAYFVFTVFCICSSSFAASSIPARILLYTATRGFRHDSIPTAIQALKNISPTINVQFDSTEDQSTFTDDNLANYDAVMFVSTTGEVLDDSGKAVFQNYLNKGGNFLGVHSASDTLNTTQFYGNELGAFFDYHPALQNATVDVIGPSHPSTAHLPSEWHVQDEMYNFKSDPRSIGAIVILAANESSYSDPGPRNFGQGNPHPLAWFQDHGAGTQNGGLSGRSWYSSLGHLNETWQNDTFMSHISGGIAWTLQSNTTKVFNASALVGNPMASSGSASSLSGSQSSITATPSTTGGDRMLTTPFVSETSLLVLLTSLILIYVPRSLL